jgi:tetratricopeptide (TPR) repeat protein
MRATLFLLWALSAAAPAAEVILVADGAQGSRVVQQLRTEAVNGVRAAAGWPKVMPSDELPGLKPGRLVTVLGACGDRKSAQRAVNALKGKLALSIRTVEGEWAGACPALDPPPPTSPTEAELQRRLLEDPEDQGALYDYAQFLQMQQRLDEAKVQLDKLLKLNPKHVDGLTLKAVIELIESTGAGSQ